MMALVAMMLILAITMSATTYEWRSMMALVTVMSMMALTAVMSITNMVSMLAVGTMMAANQAGRTPLPPVFSVARCCAWLDRRGQMYAGVIDALHAWQTPLGHLRFWT